MIEIDRYSTSLLSQMYNKYSESLKRKFQKERKKEKKKNKKNRNNVEKGGRRQYSATRTYNEVTGGKVATKSRWTIDVWPRNRVRSRLKADRPRASGSTPRQSGSRWLSRGGGHWMENTESMKRPRERGWEIPHSEERRGERKKGKFSTWTSGSGENWWKSVFHDRKIWEKL